MGFFPIPGTVSMIKLGGSARVDNAESSENSGNPNAFVPSSMPVAGEPGSGGSNEFSLHTKATRLRFELRRPTPNGKILRIFYENDFMNDSSSPSLNYRVRHLYGQGDNFLLGQTYTAFMDADSWPDVIEPQGPNSLMTKRQPQVRFIISPGPSHHAFISAEQARSEIDIGLQGFPAGSSPASSMPDIIMGYRREARWGHAQLAGLLRSVGYDTPAASGQSVLGWGVSLSGTLNTAGEDRLSWQAAYGEGIARYINDTGGLDLDAALDAGGRLEAIPAFAPMIGYTHQWTGSWRSTGTFGYVKVDALSSQGPLVLRSTQYASMNLVWQLTPSARTGIEFLHGEKETLNGATVSANRLSLVMKYDLIK
jgi:hypothetical protein